MSLTKFLAGQQVRAVTGPGNALQPEPQHLGCVGVVLGTQHYKGSRPSYLVAFPTDYGQQQVDTIDEDCLEVLCLS